MYILSMNYGMITVLIFDCFFKYLHLHKIQIIKHNYQISNMLAEPRFIWVPYKEEYEVELADMFAEAFMVDYVEILKSNNP